jgi:MFS superfamily sulfate permease-like transporter
MAVVVEPISKPTPMSLARFVPILAWLPAYKAAWLGADLVAGLTLWGLVVPEAMAYAGIANLPPQAGLYTLLASLLLYALLGTSRHLVVQATSATSALIASSVAAALVASAVANASDPKTYQAYASAFVLVTGLVFLVAGVARLGFITQFLSKPVMSGFVMGLAIFVAVGQLGGQHRREIPRHPQGAAAGELGHVRGGRPLARTAIPAAPLEQEDPGRPGGAVRDHRVEFGA